MYSLEADGYLAICEEKSNNLDTSIKEFLSTLSLPSDSYLIEGAISELPNETLYIIPLTQKNKDKLIDWFYQNKELYFYAYWTSYFKNGEILVNIGHAYNDMMEQIHISHKIPKYKIKDLEEKREFKLFTQ